MIRLKLEYTSIASQPQKNKDIRKLEGIQYNRTVIKQRYLIYMEELLKTETTNLKKKKKR